jgi:hypothetical protein
MSQKDSVHNPPHERLKLSRRAIAVERAVKKFAAAANRN